DEQNMKEKLQTHVDQIKKAKEGKITLQSYVLLKSFFSWREPGVHRCSDLGRISPPHAER
ncbi:hypothetical protein Q6247_25240, partial [Klebsiella pneumoniae]